MELMIEKGFDLKSKQSSEMLFSKDIYGNGKFDILNFPLESSKFIISQIGDKNNTKEVSEFTEKDVEIWASVYKMRLTFNTAKENGYKI
jgi:hypothetical protein